TQSPYDWSSLVFFSVLFYLVFFFQAEDGIRVGHVTGVQTCALPIYRPAGEVLPRLRLRARRGVRRRRGGDGVGEGEGRGLRRQGGPRPRAGGGAGGDPLHAHGQIGRASCRERVPLSAGGVPWRGRGG